MVFNKYFCSCVIPFLPTQAFVALLNNGITENIKYRSKQAPVTRYNICCLVKRFFCEILEINCDKRQPLMTNQNINAIM